jgi:hypothetical protein
MAVFGVVSDGRDGEGGMRRWMGGWGRLLGLSLREDGDGRVLVAGVFGDCLRGDAKKSLIDWKVRYA